jgi:hypothetical protein
VKTSWYTIDVEGIDYTLEIRNDRHRPHAPHAAWFAVQHHLKCKVTAVKRWPHAKGYFYVAQLENGKAILVRVQRLKAKEQL